MAEARGGHPSGDRSGYAFPKIGVLAFVPDRWSRSWQPRHHLPTRLARQFSVVWVESLHEWREIPDRLYTGWLKKQFDWPLLARVASRHPDWQMVLVGPVKDHPEIRPHVEELRGGEEEAEEIVPDDPPAVGIPRESGGAV